MIVWYIFVLCRMIPKLTFQQCTVTYVHSLECHFCKGGWYRVGIFLRDCGTVTNTWVYLFLDVASITGQGIGSLNYWTGLVGLTCKKRHWRASTCHIGKARARLHFVHEIAVHPSTAGRTWYCQKFSCPVDDFAYEVIQGMWFIECSC